MTEQLDRCPARPSACSAAAAWAPASRTPSCSPAPRSRSSRRDEDAAAAARARVRESASPAAVERGTPRRQRGRDGGAALASTTDSADFAGCRLVVEAVPEDLRPEGRRRSPRSRRRSPPDAVLASNTSSLSIDAARRRAAPARTLPRPALLQPGAGLGAGRDRARRRPRAGDLVARPRGWVDALGKTADRRQGLPGLRVLTARRRDRARGDAHARGGRRVGRGHRHRHGARLQAPHRPAAGTTTSWVSTCASASPSTSPPRSASGSPRRRSCATRWPAASSAARPARASSTGPTGRDPVTT